MSNFIAVKSLGKSYSNNLASDLKTNSQKSQEQKDREALKAIANVKRNGRLTRMENRDNNRISLDIKLEQEINHLPIKENEQINHIEKIALEQVEERLIEAKEKTNVLARQYGLPEPNNPEALKHDRYHCMTCDRKLHNPDTHKGTPIEGMIDDADIRLMCCWCFGNMGEEQIKNTMRKDAEATKEIRLAIYNPESIIDTNIDIKEQVNDVKKMTKEYELYLKAKMKKYQNVVNMVGTVKHDYLQEGDYMENKVLYDCKGIYACTL